VEAPPPLSARARRFGVAAKLALAFAVVAVIPLATALAAAVWILMDQASVVESEVLWSKAKIARLAYEGRRDSLGRALVAASRDNAILVTLDLGLREALPTYLSEFARANGLDEAWIAGPDGSLVARSGSGSVPGSLAASGSVPAVTANAAERSARPVFTLGGEEGEPATLAGSIVLATGNERVLGILGGCIYLNGLCAEICAVCKTPVFFLLGPDAWVHSPGIGGEGSSPPLLKSTSARPAVGDDLEHGIGTIGGIRYLFGMAPLPELGGAARLGIAYPETAFSASRDRGLAAILLSGSLAFALAAFFGAYFRRKITLPVLSLAAAAREIADGVYGKAVELRAADEVGDLARDFDRMSMRLAEQVKERAESESALRASELQFRSIFDGVSDPIFVHDLDTGAIVDGNRALEEIFGMSIGEAKAGEIAGLSEGIPPYDAAHSAALLRRAAAGERPVTEWRSRRRDGSLFWTELALKRASIGGVDRILVVCRDIDARKKAEQSVAESLHEKETLLKEIHHRVKNNFQIINSLFDLQLMGTEDPVIQESLREPKSRIHAMALIHERLYQSGTLSSIDFAEYVGELARELYLSYNADTERISLVVDVESVMLDMDRAIPCGLILNELMTNSLKYAFPRTGRGGTITVRLRSGKGAVILSVEDDGIGFDTEATSRSAASLGLTLVRILSDQLRGSFGLETVGGVRASLRFPVSSSFPSQYV